MITRYIQHLFITFIYAICLQCSVGLIPLYVIIHDYIAITWPNTAWSRHHVGQKCTHHINKAFTSTWKQDKRPHMYSCCNLCIAWVSQILVQSTDICIDCKRQNNYHVTDFQHSTIMRCNKPDARDVIWNVCVLLEIHVWVTNACLSN